MTSTSTSSVTSFPAVTSSTGSVQLSKKPRSKPKCAVKRQTQRRAANVRERNRMKTINGAFHSLRERLPIACRERKVSKVDTLRLAINYIQHLSDTLQHLDTAPATLDTCSRHYVTQEHFGSDVTAPSCRFEAFSENCRYFGSTISTTVTAPSLSFAPGVKNQPLPFVQGQYSSFLMFN